MKKILIACLLVAIAYTLPAQTKTIQEKLGYSKDTKLVIIHADDLGVSHSENSASTYAMEKGSVSSASIMVPCPWFPEIADYARAHPQADLGLHLTLTSEWKNYKWGPSLHGKVSSLVNGQGFLYSSVDSLATFAVGGEMEEEIRNQVKRSIQFGMDPTHLDAHMAGAFSRLDFLKSYIKVGHEFKLPVFLTRLLEGSLKIKLDSLISNNDVIVDEILTASPADFKAGFKDFYTRSIKNLKPGLTYLIIHTAYDNDEMKAVTIDHPDWGSAWRQSDFDFFTSNECAALLKENKVVVITWREIRDKIVRGK